MHEIAGPRLMTGPAGVQKGGSDDTAESTLESRNCDHLLGDTTKTHLQNNALLRLFPLQPRKQLALPPTGMPAT